MRVARAGMLLGLAGLGVFTQAARAEVGGGGGGGGGGSGATTSPATIPASRPVLPPKARMVIPPGFEKWEVGGRYVVVEAKDKPWIERSMAAAKPATRPSTMPSDLIDTIKRLRGDLETGLSADLDTDKSVVSAWVDNRMLADLQEFDASPAVIVGLVTTKERLKQVLAGGWETPALRFDRVTGEFYPSTTMVLSDDPGSAEALWPLLYDQTKPESERVAELTKVWEGIDSMTMRAKAQRAQFMLQAMLLKFAGEQAAGTGNGGTSATYTAEQEWLPVGLAGNVTAKYLSLLTGLPRSAIVEAMVSDRRAYIRTGAVDLLHPLSPASMRPEAVLAYTDAYRRKSVRIMDELILRSGDEIMPRLLRAVKEKKPADGKALAALVREMTGMEIETKLRPD